METKQQTSFQFINFIVRESHIVFKQPGELNINVNLSPSGIVYKSLSQYHLQLVVDVVDKDDKLNIKIISEAVFQFKDTEDYASNLFTINAPAIAFPYIRAYIATLTTQSG
ncbi:MAG: protein export chaperone secb, partial [Bacteroidia bacterium]